MRLGKQMDVLRRLVNIAAGKEIFGIFIFWRI